MHRKPHRFVISSIVLLVAGFCLETVTLAAAPRSSSLMDISADGALLACANRDSGSVTIIDLKSHTKLREITVGNTLSKPECLAFLGNSHQLAVALYHDDKIIFADADTGKVTGELEVFDEPYGLVSCAKGDKLYATLSYPGQIIEIDAKTRAITRTFEAGKFPRGIAITADDTRLFYTEYYTANVIAIDTATGKESDRWEGIRSDNLCRQIALHPTRPKAYIPHIRSATERAHGEGSIFPYVTVIDTDQREGRRRNRIPMDSFISVHVTANPWEVAIAPDGRRLYSVFSGTNDMYVTEVVDDDYRELRHRSTLQLGNNPRAVRVSPDSQTFYIYNALDFNIVAYDANTLRQRAVIAVCDSPLSAEQLLGKQLFYTALQPMAGKRWISCSSCHPDGENDARTWQNPEGLRDTPSLAAMSWTHPLHWSADRDEVQDFEHTIRGNLMQGRGLIRNQRRLEAELGMPLKGTSEELDALAAYSNTHKVPLSPHAKHGLSDAAKRGRDLFFSKQTNCASCHTGPYFTDSTPSEKIIRHDVGTGGDDPSEKMGPQYDTPTLLGIYRTTPYLHHGKAATLLDVLTTQNKHDKHGKTSHLSTNEISDLVEFLKALPYEDPEPRARELKMKQVVR